MIQRTLLDGEQRLLLWILFTLHLDAAMLSKTLRAIKTTFQRGAVTCCSLSKKQK